MAYTEAERDQWFKVWTETYGGASPKPRMGVTMEQAMEAIASVTEEAVRMGITKDDLDEARATLKGGE